MGAHPGRDIRDGSPVLPYLHTPLESIRAALSDDRSLRSSKAIVLPPSPPPHLLLPRLTDLLRIFQADGMVEVELFDSTKQNS